jgi:UDP-N-acetylglucosamine--N-acetylmuramyl-(pentapeptide) pyrophosphoryl-undecaprenol N-acetylglucosamine transferase
MGFAYSVGFFLAGMGVRPVFVVARGDRLAAERLRVLGDVVEAVMPRRPGEPLEKTFPRWFGALVDSLRLPRCAVFVSTGSNQAVLPALALWLRGAVLLNLESIDRFTVPARAVRVLRPFSAATVIHWPEQRRLYPDAVVVGPVYEPPAYKPRDEAYILVTAGTQGFPELFSAVEALGLRNVVLQTGHVDPEPYRRRNPSWTVFRFDPDFHRWLAGARIVITQFPGTTAATAALAYRKPVVMVVNPNLPLAASTADAVYYARRLRAVLLSRPSAKLLRRALKLAERIEPPSYPNGGRTLANLAVSIIKSYNQE